MHVSYGCCLNDTVGPQPASTFNTHLTLSSMRPEDTSNYIHAMILCECQEGTKISKALLFLLETYPE